MNQLPIESSDPSLLTWPFFSIIQLILHGATIQGIAQIALVTRYSLPRHNQNHLDLDILACSNGMKTNSSSIERSFDVECDTPFGIAPSLVTWPSHSILHVYVWPDTFQIHLIMNILACSGRIKVVSGVLESSHRALSIGCSFKA